MGRKFWGFFGGLCAAWLWCAAPPAGAFPTKPVRIVIGFPAGGPLDLHARLLADRLQAVLGQPVLIDDKSGAGGTVGAQEVMKATPDGHTLMLANTGVMVINPVLYQRLPHNSRTHVWIELGLANGRLAEPPHETEPTRPASAGWDNPR